MPEKTPKKILLGANPVGHQKKLKILKSKKFKISGRKSKKFFFFLIFFSLTVVYYRDEVKFVIYSKKFNQEQIQKRFYQNP